MDHPIIGHLYSHYKGENELYVVLSVTKENNSGTPEVFYGRVFSAQGKPCFEQIFVRPLSEFMGVTTTGVYRFSLAPSAKDNNTHVQDFYAQYLKIQHNISVNQFNDYQKAAKKTAIFPPEHSLEYPVLGFCSEVGEVASLVKKQIRDGVPFSKEKMESELGDCLWYLAVIAETHGLSLQDIAQKNLQKLAARKDRGTLKGSGDER